MKASVLAGVSEFVYDAASHPANLTDKGKRDQQDIIISHFITYVAQSTLHFASRY